jgi:hypothetical protein
MYKLLMRAFPRYYAPNSVYALYPFTTPQQVRESFGKQGASGDLDYKVPSFQGPVTAIKSWEGVTHVLNQQKHFHVPCETREHIPWNCQPGLILTIPKGVHIHSSSHTTIIC